MERWDHPHPGGPSWQSLRCNKALKPRGKSDAFPCFFVFFPKFVIYALMIGFGVSTNETKQEQKPSLLRFNARSRTLEMVPSIVPKLRRTKNEKPKKKHEYSWIWEIPSSKGAKLQFFRGLKQKKTTPRLQVSSNYHCGHPTWGTQVVNVHLSCGLELPMNTCLEWNWGMSHFFGQDLHLEAAQVTKVYS